MKPEQLDLDDSLMTRMGRRRWLIGMGALVGGVAAACAQPAAPSPTAPPAAPAAPTPLPAKPTPAPPAPTPPPGAPPPPPPRPRRPTRRRRSGHGRTSRQAGGGDEASHDDRSQPTDELVRRVLAWRLLCCLEEWRLRAPEPQDDCCA